MKNVLILTLLVPGLIIAQDEPSASARNHKEELSASEVMQNFRESIDALDGKSRERVKNGDINVVLTSVLKIDDTESGESQVMRGQEVQQFVENGGFINLPPNKLAKMMHFAMSYDRKEGIFISSTIIKAYMIGAEGLQPLLEELPGNHTGDEKKEWEERIEQEWGEPQLTNQIHGASDQDTNTWCELHKQSVAFSKVPGFRQEAIEGRCISQMSLDQFKEFCDRTRKDEL